MTGKVSKETRWYISSLYLDAEQALKVVRGHWQVESEAQFGVAVFSGKETHSNR